MKLKIATFILALSMGLCSYAQKIVYTDAAKFPVYGKISTETNERYERLPSKLENVSRKDVWKLGRSSAGLYIRFRSNTTSMRVKWQSTFDNEQNHMTDLGTRGLDLYALVEGEWRAVAPVRPTKKGVKMNSPRLWLS